MGNVAGVNLLKYFGEVARATGRPLAFVGAACIIAAWSMAGLLLAQEPDISEAQGQRASGITPTVIGTPVNPVAGKRFGMQPGGNLIFTWLLGNVPATQVLARFPIGQGSQAAPNLALASGMPHYAPYPSVPSCYSRGAAQVTTPVASPPAMRCSPGGPEPWWGSVIPFA